MKSLLGRLIALQILCGIVGVGLLYGLLDRTLRADATAQFNVQGRTITEMVAKACESPLVFRDLTTVQSVLDASLKTPNVEWAYVTGPDGSVVAHTFVPEFPQQFLSATPAQLLSGLPNPNASGAQRVSTFSIPILTGIVGSVHVGLNQHNLEAAVHHAERVVFGSITLMMLALVTIVSLFTRQVIAPIRQLTRAARSLACDVHAAPAPLPVLSRDEIGLLTGAFNTMACDIRQNQDRLEFRVAERTRELARANTELTGEIRDRRLVEKALRDSETRYRTVIEQVREVIFTADARGNWTFLNPAWTQITGFDVEETLGRPFLHYVYEEDHASTLVGFHAMVAGEQDYFCHEMRYLTKDGGLCWIEARGQRATDAEGHHTGFFGTLNDISARKQAEEKLHHQALHDALTGLPNRALFQDRLHGALTRRQRSHGGIAVLFVDLDNFKAVNDTMGHEAGDALLMTIASRLQSCGRTEDTIARLGGDEFTLLLENLTDAQDAINVAERIVTQLQQPISLGSQEVFASASIGIMYSEETAADADALLRDADTAMYHAKARGKSGYVLFDPSMNKGIAERLEIETGLRLAVEREELRVHYQPLVDLQTGRLCGMEALVRWEHPTRGLMPPGTFIPIAEETGLIVPIGYWVLEEACRRVQEWKNSCPDAQELIINVNLSGRQLQRPDVIPRVQEALEKSGLSAAHLKLEITESVMMADMDATLVKLRALKAMGVQLAMDDFGTGYSSIASMSLFPLDTVKIDRAFINRLDESEEARAIMAAIVMLARAMRLNVTAEGIETSAQRTHLQSLGCNVGQGYHFARPLPLKALHDYAANEHGFPNACISLLKAA